MPCFFGFCRYTTVPVMNAYKGSLVQKLRWLHTAICHALLCSFMLTSAQAASPPKVALVMKSLANEFFQTMQEGARAHQKAHAGEYQLLTNGIRDEIDTA